jgi:hypothetical protein
MNKFFLIISLCICVLFNATCENKKMLSAFEKEENFCSLVASPEKFESKFIQTKAIVLGYHAFIFYNGQCLESDKILALEMNYNSRKKLIETINSKKVNYSKSFLNNNLYAEITVSGKMEKYDGEEETLVFHPKYKFFVSEIKEVNILSEEIFPSEESRELE